jgi:transcription initiation factor TFIIIB Brf1 subunit/transcription initiation factor TFIIB
MRCDPDFCCGKEWDAPDPTPCPKCGQIETVKAWEAWGHPNGELYCKECDGYNTDRPVADYFTWHMRDSEYVVNHWRSARRRTRHR